VVINIDNPYSNFGRECAIVLYKDRIYADVDHQHAYELALNDEGKSMNLNLEGVDIVEAERIVNENVDSKTISTWHWYYDGNKNYLICNFKEDFFSNYGSKAILDYAREHNMALGYHNPEPREFTVHDDKYLLGDKDVVLDKGQIRLLSMILIELRKTLLHEGYRGEEFVLEEEDGFVVLRGSDIQVIDGVCNKDINLVDVVDKTVELLVTGVPFPVKRVFFTIEENYLSGKMKESEELGSIEMYLR